MPLHLTEGDVDGLITPAEAVDAIEECFHRLARGVVENMPRRRLRMPDGALAVMAAADAELGTIPYFVSRGNHDSGWTELSKGFGHTVVLDTTKRRFGAETRSRSETIFGAIPGWMSIV